MQPPKTWCFRSETGRSKKTQTRSTNSVATAVETEPTAPYKCPAVRDPRPTVGGSHSPAKRAERHGSRQRGRTGDDLRGHRQGSKKDVLMAHDERVALGGDRLKRLVAAVFQILGVWHLSVAALMHIRDRLDRGAQGFVAPPSVAKQGR